VSGQELTSGGAGTQLGLFAPAAPLRREKLNAALDRIALKFGTQAVTTADLAEQDDRADDEEEDRRSIGASRLDADAAKRKRSNVSPRPAGTRPGRPREGNAHAQRPRLRLRRDHRPRRPGARADAPGAGGRPPRRLPQVLVTGRAWADLVRELPNAGTLFDRLVLENGAVLYRPGGTPVPLADPVDERLDAELARHGVDTFRGLIQVALEGRHEELAREIADELRLDVRFVRNRDAVMVLPISVSKASGLSHALASLGVCEGEAVAFGDAENDVPCSPAAPWAWRWPTRCPRRAPAPTWCWRPRAPRAWRGSSCSSWSPRGRRRSRCRTWRRGRGGSRDDRVYFGQ
jgi:hypothetical protein